MKKYFIHLIVFTLIYIPRIFAQYSGSNYDGYSRVVATPETRLPSIALNATNLNFTANQYGVLPVNQTLTISNGGGGTLSWTITDDASWLDINPTSGTDSGIVTISINTANLSSLTSTAKITITASGASNSPRTINVTYNLTAYPTTISLNNTVSFPSKNTADYTSADYKIIGLPGDSKLLANTFCSGSQGPDWKIYWDNGASSDYYVKFDNSANFQFTTGRAYWVLSKNSLSINRSVNSSSINSSGEAEITLHSGWNLITNPFLTSIAWSKIQSYNNITQSISTYNNGSLSNSSTFDPYIGYTYDNKDNKSKLLIPYKLTFSTLSKVEDIVPYDWKIDIELSSDGFLDKTISFGVSDLANNFIDVYDQRKPRIIAEIPVGYFRQSSDAYLSSDIRKEIEESQVWNLEVKSFGRESKLIFSGLNGLPEYYKIYLLDEEKSKCFDLREDTVYKFTSISNISKFNIIVGKERAVKEKLSKVSPPTEFVLGNNYPNPFNPSTNIPVTIPQQSEIQLAIYNTLGNLIRILYSGNLGPGKFLFDWNGKDEIGNTVSSGIYIYQLTTNSGVKVSNKMILMK